MTVALMPAITVPAHAIGGIDLGAVNDGNNASKVIVLEQFGGYG